LARQVLPREFRGIIFVDSGCVDAGRALLLICRSFNATPRIQHCPDDWRC
jgi:hypothetical protein